MYEFLKNMLYQNEQGLTDIAKLRKKWLATLPPEQRTGWSKARFAGALGAAGLTLARDEHGRDCIVGRSVYARRLTVGPDGILRRVAAA